jgi:tetratricopeptide (TPR) repeat protein
MDAARAKRLLGVFCAALLALRSAAGAAGAPAAGDPTALVAAGEAALAAFDLERALAAFRSARDTAPRGYEPAWKLARALVYRAMLTPDAGESDRLSAEAAALARDAIAIDPAGAPGHLYLAIAAGRLADRASAGRRIELARETWSEATTALQADPGSDLAHHVLGVWNRGVAEVDPVPLFFARLLHGPLPAASLGASAAHLRRAVEIQPASIAHRVELGVTLAAAGSLAEAREQIERGLALPDRLVIDGYYRALGRGALARIDRKLRKGTTR